MANSNANPSFKRSEVKSLVTVRSLCSDKENWNQHHFTAYLCQALFFFFLILTKILQFKHNIQDMDEE